jgi:hypothetical protein
MLHRPVETAHVELNTARPFIDVATAGIGPPMVEVEGNRGFVAVQDPQPGVSEVVGSQTVEGGVVQPAANPATPHVGVEVQGVKIAERRVGAVAGTSGGPVAANPTTTPVTVATTTLVRGPGFVSVSDQNCSRSEMVSPERTSSASRPW